MKVEVAAEWVMDRAHGAAEQIRGAVEKVGEVIVGGATKAKEGTWILRCQGAILLLHGRAGRGEDVHVRFLELSLWCPSIIVLSALSPGP